MIPHDAAKIDVEGATVDFFTFENDEATFFAFDTSRCGPPEPMVNAMAGLKLLDRPEKKLLMINHKMPMGLFDKLGERFDIQKHERDDGLSEVIFGFKGSVDLSASQFEAKCHG
ncbi:MAG: hypothetical protein JXK05_08315 [Campylobacterales bacterium]|nr:hypothetical protein [Campylobacterales bacterium]